MPTCRDLDTGQRVPCSRPSDEEIRSIFARSTPVRRGRVERGQGVITSTVVTPRGRSTSTRRGVRPTVPTPPPDLFPEPKGPTARGGPITMVGPPTTTPQFPGRSPTVPQNPLSTGEVLGPVANTACMNLSEPWRSLCLAGSGAVFGRGEDDPRATGLTASGCPEGFEPDADGECVRTGIIGATQRMLPGGASGTLSDVYGDAVVGAFGMPALVPAQVGVITDRFGNQKPILRCPRGAVLGLDDLCYQKPIPRKFRKWKPAKKPPISRKDWAAIQAIDRVQDRLKDLNKKACLVTPKKRIKR